MPFKIVETIEKGKAQLSIVPSRWEKKGLLRWPPKKFLTSKLVMDENSIPLVDWLTTKCTVKRTSITFYRRAEEEIEMMTQNSDTDVTDIEMRNTSINETINYNDMASNLILHPNNEPLASTSSTSKTVFSQASDDIIQIINDAGKIIATSVNTEQPVDVDKLFSNQKQILDNQITIMQNQSLIHETQNSIVEQEKKNSHQLKNLSVQLDYYFARFNPQSSDVVLLSESNPAENTSFILKPMSNIRELQDFEEKLADKTQNKVLKQQYLLLCPKSEGSGTKCSYKLLDILFTKEFLCQFSWSGGSRNTNVVKIALKGYKRFLRFFFDVINCWDPLFTLTDVEDFFKSVLKNSIKRLQTKNIRASSKRKRIKKVTSTKTQKTTTETVRSENENEDVSCENNKNEEVSNEPNVQNDQETFEHSGRSLDSSVEGVETDRSHEESEKDVATDPKVTDKEIENMNMENENTENYNEQGEKETTNKIYKETPV